MRPSCHCWASSSSVRSGLPEQAVADIATYRQQQLLAQRATPSRSRKRKEPSTVDPMAALHDQLVYTPEQTTNHLAVRFVA